MKICVWALLTSLLLLQACEESPPEDGEASAADTASKAENPKKSKTTTEELDPRLKKIHNFGREYLKTRAKFYESLKKVVANKRLPPEPMKEEIEDLYEYFERKFVEHGYKMKSLGGDTRGLILKVDNYITAEPMGQTIWLEKNANRLAKREPDLAELLLRAYSLPKCYDFDLLRKHNPFRAKRLGLME